MGRLWRFDEAINTDVLAPGIYMKSSLEVLAPHCLEAVRPEFASQVRQVMCLWLATIWALGPLVNRLLKC